MNLTTDLTRRLGIRHPVIAAPMAGPATTPALVAAVGEAGGFGFLGGAYSTPAQIEAACADVRARTAKPFGINLFTAQTVPPLPDDAADALALIAQYHAELGLAPPDMPRNIVEPFPEQMRAVLASGVSVFSFTFGIPP